MNHNEYSDKILNELNQKYNKTFEISKLTYEVNGDKGNYYRAVCKEKGSEQTFVAYYYLNGSDYLLSEEVGEDISSKNDAPILVDEYTNLLVAQALNDLYCSKNNSILFTVSDVGAFDYVYTLEDVKKGVEYCVANEKFDTQVESYIFVDSSIADKKAFEDSFVAEMLSLNIYKQSLNFIYISKEDLSAVKSDYKDDIFTIQEKAEDDTRIAKYCWYFAERGKGIVNQDTVKGV